MSNYRQISQSAFELHIQDIDNLRAQYARACMDVPRALVRTLKRKDLVYLLLKHKYGEKSASDYFIQCEQWKMFDPPPQSKQ